jgi:hypothetical protein
MMNMSKSEKSAYSITLLPITFLNVFFKNFSTHLKSVRNSVLFERQIEFLKNFVLLLQY